MRRIKYAAQIGNRTGLSVTLDLALLLCYGWNFLKYESRKYEGIALSRAIMFNTIAKHDCLR